jgi:acyl-CoA reductase-like NAD-dependent aldehyde dehydrogenase
MSAIHPLILAGKEIDTGNYITVCHPYDGRVVGKCARADAELMEKAISGAYSARKMMAELPRHQREKILLSAADLVEKNGDRLAELITLEMGKVIRESLGEVNRAVFTLRTAAKEVIRIGGELIPLDLHPAGAGRTAILARFPIGVVGAITPFNFPLNLVAHKLAPAVAAGCPVVLKPSSTTPLIALELARRLLQAGLPPEGLSVLPCSPKVGETLAADERVALLTFTGSAPVGWRLKEKAFRKKVTLELGGNAAAIVCADADRKWALERLAVGGFSNAGQSCISVQRVLIERSIYEGFVADLVARVQALKLGDPMDKKSDLGSMVNEQEAKKSWSWLQEALNEGAEALCGNRLEGAKFYPTVVAQVNPQMKVWSEEVFCPLVTVTPFDSFEQAIELANTTRFGLQAGVFTRDIANIARAFRLLEVGGVIINDVPTFRVDHMPYGGVKESGTGREGPRFAIEEMTEPKLLVLGESWGM